MRWMAKDKIIRRRRRYRSDALLAFVAAPEAGIRRPKKWPLAPIRWASRSFACRTKRTMTRMSETKTPRTFPVASAISSQTDATIVDPAIANPGPPAGSFDDIFAMPVPETDADREAARFAKKF